jgi:hypothetical protein
MTRWLIEGILGGMLVITIVLMTLSYLQVPKGYECMWVEITPDAPEAYKKACRSKS